MDDARPAAPHLDPALEAWVISRHADVVAALRAPQLAPAGDGAVVREATARALTPERLAALRERMAASARALVADLATDTPVDLVGALAAPWSLDLAAAATGLAVDAARVLAESAHRLFLAAAHATDATFPPSAQTAAAELARALTDVQSFVALTQTLPAVLAAAWRELLRHPDAAERLRAHPALVPGAVDELLRLAGPSRAVFRAASATVHIGGATIAAGDRVALLLAAANRDPARFPDPDRLDLARGDARAHLAFGRGAHVCPGAPLIRLAVAEATGALLAGTAALEAAGEPTWLGGFAIRAPATLPAIVRRLSR